MRYYPTKPDEQLGSTYFQIYPVELTTRGRTGPQSFDRSPRLLLTLHDFGARGIEITRLKINNHPVPQASIDVLNTYLRLNKGLIRFMKNTSIEGRMTKWHWQQLCENMGINTDER